MVDLYQVFLPSYTVGGNDIYEKIYDQCHYYGEKVAIIGGKKGIQTCLESLQSALLSANIEITGVLYYGGEASAEQALAISGTKEVARADMIFAVGGGKVIDTGKLAGMYAHLPVFTFPTIASTCAAVSAVSVSYGQDHSFDKVIELAEPPRHCFINVNSIAAAPERYIWAGMGDTVAKHYEPLFSSRGDILDHTNEMGMLLSGICVKTLVEYGSQALADCRNNEPSWAVMQVALTIIVSTGLVSNFVLEPYNSVIAHAIAYGLMEIPVIEAEHLHGEAVAYGTLVLLAVDGQWDEFRSIYLFNQSVGLPVRLRDMDISVTDVPVILAKAATVNDLVKAPYVITKSMLYSAIIQIEAYTL